MSKYAKAMKTRAENLTLKNGDKIAIIGSGPAGSFFADLAADMAQRKGLNLSIVLFDWKDFTKSGPSGCNLCAGVISETLVERLKNRGMILPKEKVQQKIGGYYIQSKAGGFLLKHQLDEKRITTVFRGNGPRTSTQDRNVSFDDYLLDHLRSKGLHVIHKSVKGIELPRDPGKPVRIIYGIGKEELSLEADLVIGAFGLSEVMMKKIKNLNFGYRPPHTVRAQNVEIPLKNDFLQEHFDNNIFAYNWSTAKRIRAAIIIPKKNYITVNMLGKRDVDKDDLLEFLNFLVDHKKLPKNWKWSHKICHCAPKIATTSAKKPFTNRLVIIGDASCSKYYKSGIESAFISSQLAVEAVFNWGISESSLKIGYFRRLNKIIVKDNYYGRILFKINDLVSRSAFLSGVMLKVVMDEEGHDRVKRMRGFLWNMYTGNIPYKEIFLKFLNPVLQWRLIVTTFKLGFTMIFSRLFIITRKSRSE
ncbi:MAG TPA: hypothetical protein ENI15_03235 [Spirochaetes bacterium]|nr:hypothetical protein [Spirochaetota bacterium]